MGAFDHFYLCYMTFIFCELTLQVLAIVSTSYRRIRHLSHNIIQFLRNRTVKSLEGCSIRVGNENIYLIYSTINMLSSFQMAAMCLLQVNIVRPKFLSAPRSTIHVGMELAVWITSHITRVSVWWATLGRTVPSI